LRHSLEIESRHDSPQTITDPLDRTITFSYDELGRMIRSVNAAGDAIEYVYGQGPLTRMFQDLPAAIGTRVSLPPRTWDGPVGLHSMRSVLAATEGR
jgi:YD repeat-containing protein